MAWTKDASREFRDKAGNTYVIDRYVETRDGMKIKAEYKTSQGYPATRMDQGVFQIEHPRMGSVEVTSDEEGFF